MKILDHNYCSNISVKSTKSFFFLFVFLAKVYIMLSFTLYALYDL